VARLAGELQVGRGAEGVQCRGAAGCVRGSGPYGLLMPGRGAAGRGAAGGQGPRVCVVHRGVCRGWGCLGC